VSKKSKIKIQKSKRNAIENQKSKFKNQNAK